MENLNKKYCSWWSGERRKDQNVLTQDNGYILKKHRKQKNEHFRPLVSSRSFIWLVYLFQKYPAEIYKALQKIYHLFFSNLWCPVWATLSSRLLSGTLAQQRSRVLSCYAQDSQTFTSVWWQWCDSPPWLGRPQPISLSCRATPSLESKLPKGRNLVN